VALLHGLGPHYDAPVSVRLADTPNLDAFGRVRVSEPVGLFASQLQYGLDPLLWLTTLTTAGMAPTETHLPLQSSARLRLPAGATAGAIGQRQTRQAIRYQAGKSALAMVSFAFDGDTTNVRRDVGYFADHSGVFLRYEGGVASLVRRTSVSGAPVDSAVAQSTWSFDHFDGTGPSGKVLDWTKSQILAIDLEWLGAGRVRIGFVIDGLFCLAHQFMAANLVAGVYMTTANLPITYRIEATGAVAADADLQCICAMVASEGGFDVDRGFRFSAGTGPTARVLTTEVVLVALHPDPNCPAGGSVLNEASAYLDGLSVFVNTAHQVYWRLVYGATLDSTGWADVDPAFSGMRWSTTAVYTGGTGIQLAEGYASATIQAKLPFSREGLSRLPLLRNGFGVAEGANCGNVAILCRVIGGAGAADVYGALEWTELY
jgi:hypothetical protein